MPDLSTVALVVSAILLGVFLIAWLVLLNRKYRHTAPTVDPSWLLTKKSWVGNYDPFQSSSLRNDANVRSSRITRQNEETKTNLEERVKHRSRVFMHHIYAYCRSLRTERSVSTLYSLMGRREDKIFCLVDDPFINQTFLSYADPTSHAPRVKTLMYVMRVAPRTSSKAKYAANSAPMARSSGHRGGLRSSSSIPSTGELTAADYTLANMFAIETTPQVSASQTTSSISEVPDAATYGIGAPGLTDEEGLRVFHPPLMYTTARYDNLIRSFILTLTQSHPFLLPVLDCGFSFDKRTAFVCRPLLASGSLRDLLWSVGDPTAPISVKYPTLDRSGINGRDDTSISPRPFTLQQIAKYGRQVLEGLVYLDQIGLPFVNLHLGNVLYCQEEDKVVLSEVESGLLGVYPRHLKRLHRAGPHDPVVVAFAIMLFEMATGQQLPIPRYPNFPVLDALSGTYDDIADIIKFIFLPRAPLLGPEGRHKLKKYQASASVSSTRTDINKLVADVFTEGLPPYVTCRDLLKFPFFADVKLNQQDQSRLPNLGEASPTLAEQLKEDIALEKLLGEDDRHALQYRKTSKPPTPTSSRASENVEEHKDSRNEMLSRAVALFLPTPPKASERPQSASAPYDTLHLSVDRRVKVMLWNAILPLCSALPLAAHTLKDRLGVVKGMRYAKGSAGDSKTELDLLKAGSDNARWKKETEVRRAKKAKDESSRGFFGFLYSYDDDADEEDATDDVSGRGQGVEDNTSSDQDDVISPYAAALNKYTGSRQREPKSQRLEGLGAQRTTTLDEYKVSPRDELVEKADRTSNKASKSNRSPREKTQNVVIDFSNDDENLFG